ncbi:2-oxoglutarate-dependent dioxygenase DAO [Thalictrum thalictroides]|uniref:2-oxoglutarate-dependent dioxygenase DAO n=1 Tax=Thalictrum thalictroides TaxID=46969 RepID=A0A7J6XCQ3_THATH|nr:2-oxoglutarate-dependent dioxygenase DAO [Thalictrum thalictroides]
MDLKVDDDDQIIQIPLIDFTKGHQDLEEGSDGWKNLCDQVRQACEEYGCFQVVYSKISVELCEEMFKSSKELFDLPDETKMKNTGSKPYNGYIGKIDVVPLYESLGIEDVLNLEAVQAFVQLMWPDGNSVFCEIVNSMTKKMYELNLTILKLLMESYGVEKYYSSHVDNSDIIFRAMKYKAPNSNDSEIGLQPHVDKSCLSILCQDSVQGLEVLSREGNWFRVAPLPGAFTVFIGDALKAWSNGRLHGVKHRVMMNGDKERYSFGLFSSPKEGLMIEVPDELVDKEHPLLFRSFNYTDFLHYYYSHIDDGNELEVYAGVV